MKLEMNAAERKVKLLPFLLLSSQLREASTEFGLRLRRQY
jgi:hypothetical protein